MYVYKFSRIFTLLQFEIIREGKFRSYRHWNYGFYLKITLRERSNDKTMSKDYELVYFNKIIINLIIRCVERVVELWFSNNLRWNFTRLAIISNGMTNTSFSLTHPQCMRYGMTDWYDARFLQKLKVIMLNGMTFIRPSFKSS